MKSLETNDFPTPEQLYALELAARRARSREIARLVKAGARALTERISRIAAVLQTKGAKHA